MDDARLAALYRKYGPAVYSRCRRILRDESLAEDATQEVFVRVLRHIDEAPDDEAALRWVYRIATNYCLDLAGKPQLAELLRALGEVEIPWVRVHYAYPTGLTSEVLTAYREVPNVLPYLDLPLQHSHPEVLRAMNRPWQADVTGGVLKRIREQLPDAVLRTLLRAGPRRGKRRRR